MRLEFQRKLDRVLGSFICRVFSLFEKFRPDPPVHTEPCNILVILLSEMGSLVMARPMLDHLKRNYPGASIYALLFERNRQFLELLDVIPSKNILTVTDASLLKMAADSWRAIVKMRRIKIEIVLDCELFSRISSIYSFLSGAKIRVGFHPHTQEGLYRGDFINRPVPYNPYVKISQQFITLAQALESEGVPKVKRKITADHLEIPPLKVNQKEINDALKKFNIDFPHVTNKKLILIHPGGGLLPIRAWPLQYYCELTKTLTRKDYAVGVIGLEMDKTLAEGISVYCESNNCIDLTGYTRTVRELMIIFHFAALLITNDGGPGQFASMTPLPVITLFGPETPLLYGPLSSKAYNFYVPLSCSPCLTAYNHRNSPCDGNNVCLKSIHPETVLAKACEILKSI